MTDTTTATLNGVAPLPHLGVIRVQGEDAARFLQGQMTQDFALLGPDQARLAAYCSPKGRMLASFIGLRDGDDGFLLVCSRDILAQTLKRLGMFVLRAKVRLSDASAEVQLAGLAGDAIHSIAAGGHPTLEMIRFEHGKLVWLHPADSQARALWIAPAGTSLPAGSALDTALWQWGDVLSGVAPVTAPIVDAFVPQMLNYESVGGVNFKKGCYPGQEVVARSQFRGAIKRRAFVGWADGAVQAGQEVFSASEPEQPAGLIAQAAAVAGGTAVIAALRLDALPTALAIGHAAGVPLRDLHIPYALREDI